MVEAVPEVGHLAARDGSGGPVQDRHRPVLDGEGAQARLEAHAVEDGQAVRLQQDAGALQQVVPRPALQHQHVLAAGGEERGGDRPARPAADHHGIDLEVLAVHRVLPLRRTDMWTVDGRGPALSKCGGGPVSGLSSSSTHHLFPK